MQQQNFLLAQKFLIWFMQEPLKSFNYFSDDGKKLLAMYIIYALE